MKLMLWTHSKIDLRLVCFKRKYVSQHNDDIYVSYRKFRVLDNLFYLQEMSISYDNEERLRSSRFLAVSRDTSIIFLLNFIFISNSNFEESDYFGLYKNLIKFYNESYPIINNIILFAF